MDYFNGHNGELLILYSRELSYMREMGGGFTERRGINTLSTLSQKKKNKKEKKKEIASNVVFDSNNSNILNIR